MKVVYACHFSERVKYMKLSSVMGQLGEEFSLIRNNEVIAAVDGIRGFENDRKIINFSHDTDIQSRDWVKAKTTNEEFYIDDVITTMGLKRKAFAKKAYYLTKVEQAQRETQQPSVTFNLGDVQNSIIGTQQQASLTNNFSDKELLSLIEKNCGEDKEQMTEMLKAINAIIENNTPVQKGTFAQFSDAASKYGWLLGPIATKLLNYSFSSPQ